MASLSRRLAAFFLAVLVTWLAGCQSVPVQTAPPTPTPIAATQAPPVSTTPAVVEATVTEVPQGKTQVVYRIAFKVPKGVDSISVILPALAQEVPAPAPATVAAGTGECSGGFFSCSKLVAETVSAIVAAIVALIGLVALLRKKRRGKR